jgi:hypothetical protein
MNRSLSVDQLMANIPTEGVVDPKELLEEIERLTGDDHTSQSPDADKDEPEDVLAEMATLLNMKREDYSRSVALKKRRAARRAAEEGLYHDGFLDVTDSSRESIHFTLHPPTPDPSHTPSPAPNHTSNTAFSHTHSHTSSPAPSHTSGTVLSPAPSHTLALPLTTPLALPLTTPLATPLARPLTPQIPLSICL